MERLRVIRIEESEQGALGILIFDGKFFCFTLERDSKDPLYPQIPDGEYELRYFSGTAWKGTLEILVPGHTAVLFHVGNLERDSHMCVLLGSSVGYLAKDGKKLRAVLGSRNTFNRFQDEVVPWIQDGEKVKFITIK